MPFGAGPGSSSGVSTATQTALDAKQPLDSDLTTIAGLTPGSGNVLAADGSGWISKTYAALKTALGLTKSDVGLSNVDNTADTAKPVSTAQQTALDLKAPLASPTFTGTVTLPSGTVTSGMITDGTIVDADVNASAAIAQSKIASLTTDLAAKIAASIVDAQGDLIVGTANDTVARLAKGTHGKSLVAGASTVSYDIPRNGNMTPADHSLIAWSFDPVLANSGTAYNFNTGTARVTLLYVPYATTITNIHTYIATAGTSITSGQSFAVLYDAAGTTQLGITADQSVAWATTGEKVMALTTPYVMAAPGFVKVLMWSVFGGTAPALARTAVTPASGVTNFGMTSPLSRASTADTGLTTTAPSSIGAQTATTACALVGLS